MWWTQLLAILCIVMLLAPRAKAMPTEAFCEECGNGFASSQGYYQHWSKMHAGQAGVVDVHDLMLELICDLCGNFSTVHRAILDNHRTNYCPSLTQRAVSPKKTYEARLQRLHPTVWLMDDLINGAEGLTSRVEHLSDIQRRELSWARAVFDCGLSLSTAQRLLDLGRATFQPAEETDGMAKIKTIMSRLKSPSSRFYPSTPWDRHILHVRRSLL